MNDKRIESVFGSLDFLLINVLIINQDKKNQTQKAKMTFLYNRGILAKQVCNCEK